jgi:hypothetical protein
MTLHDDSPADDPVWDDDEAWAHSVPIPLVYDPPRLGYAAEPGSGWGCLLTLCILGLLAGLFSTYPPAYEWIFHGILAFAACSLVVVAPRWWRAIHR